MRVFGTVKNSVVDGVGIRYVVFVQGCGHHCKGCHNKGSWDYNGGTEIPPDMLVTDILNTKLLKGVTFSGGEPFDKVKELGYILQKVKEKHPEYTFWSYTGYTFEELCKDTERFEFLKLLDVLVDGEYKEERREEGLRFKGSANQRLIDVQATLRGMEKGKEGVILYEC